MDAGSADLLRRAARRAARAARRRPSISAQRQFRPAARLLACGNRVPFRRAIRRLCAVAALPDRDVLVRVYARPRHRRRDTCGDGGAADGRHRRFRGADARFWAADPCHGVVVGGAVVLLAGGDREPARILVRARRRAGAASDDQRRRAHLVCRAGVGHRYDRTRARGRARLRAVDRSGGTDRFFLRPRLLARTFRRRRAAETRAVARRRNSRSPTRRLGCGSSWRCCSRMPVSPFWWCWRAAGRAHARSRRRRLSAHRLRRMR